MKKLLDLMFLALIATTLSGQGPAASPEKAANDRLRKDNGVYAGAPKVYDDALLRDMLQAASTRLAALTAFDQAKLTGAFGAVTGATLASSGFALSVAGPSSPQMVTTAKGGTETTQTTSGATTSNTSGTTSGATPSATTGTSAGTNNTTVNTVGEPVTDLVTTRPQFNAPAATAPAATAALPTQYGVSATDILSEQMQLASEIANLRLLLDGALSDQLIQDDGLRMVRPRVTIGVPVTILPQRLAKKAVAVVEVRAWSPKAARVTEASPAIVALLPKDKTYNVASITDRNMNFSGSVVLGVLGAGASYTRSRKSYFIVAAQEIVAQMITPYSEEGDDRGDHGENVVSKFAWQFRPVLGKEYVRAGMRDVFVQFGLPNRLAASPMLVFQTRTYLRKYDLNTGVVGNVIQGSMTAWSKTEIPVLDLQQQPSSLSIKDFEDQPDGTVIVNLNQRFLNGTYLRAGNRRLSAENGGLTFEENRVLVKLTAQELSAGNTRIVSRDGSEFSVSLGSCQQTPSQKTPKMISANVVATADESTTLQIEIESPKGPQGSFHAAPFALRVGQDLFRAEKLDEPAAPPPSLRLRSVIPTASLRKAASLAVLPLATEGCAAEMDAARLTAIQRSAGSYKLSVVARDTSMVDVIISGPDLASVQVVYPGGTKTSTVTNGLLVQLAGEPAKQTKAILINTSRGPITLDLPEPKAEPKPDPKKE